MPATRKPTTQLSESTLKCNVGRYADRINEPKPTAPLGNPPSHLTKDQKKVWRELAIIAPADVLTNCDRWVVEAAVLLMAKIRYTSQFSTADIAQLRSCLASMGMTPADRSRVSANKTEVATNDPWTELIN